MSGSTSVLRLRMALVAVVSVAVVSACAPSGSPSDARPPTTPISGGPSGTTAPESSSTSTVAPHSGAATTTLPTESSIIEPPTEPAASLTTCWTAEPSNGAGVSFDDATRSFGALRPLTGMHPHAAAAGDVDDDGWIDVFVGTFADRDADAYRKRGADGPAPDRLLLGGPDGFRVDETFPTDRGRSSGATFADLDGDGDDDLIVTRHQRGSEGIAGRPTVVYENGAGGWAERLTLAPGVGARSVAAADFDRDGTLDLLIAGDRYAEGSTTAYQGMGDFSFEDATARWGIPDDLTGLALATVDLDGDGWLDVVVNGDSRILRGGSGGFETTTAPELTWPTFGNEDDPAGIAVGDLDGDERPDLVLGQHYNSTVDFGERVPVRVLLNRSSSAGITFDDVTASSGSPELWTKSPHVAIVDVDNDGRNDIVTSAVTASGAPLVLRQTGRPDAVVDFEPVGQPGDGDYFVTGVSDDFDRDGRVDLLLLAWEPERPSLLARNTSGSGDWIEVDPDGIDVSQVRISDAATGSPLTRHWPEHTTGYASGPSDVAHFGLGAAPPELTVELVMPDGSTAAGVAPANSRVTFGRC